MHTEGRNRGRRLSGSRLCAALSVAAIAATTASLAPATASPVPGESIAANRNITVFHNVDFVAVFGWPLGQTITVDVIRNGVTIGTARGPSVSTPDGPGLEVNHGPAGAPQPGDCWVGSTPDIRPGDKIRVTHGATRSAVIVDNITFSGPATESPTGNVEVRGVAKFANGANIPVGRLDSGEFRDVLPNGQYRATPDQIVAEGVDGGFVMVYNAPFNGFRQPADSTPEQRKASLLNSGGHATGFGHVAPLPRESMLVDGIDDAPGPALGCEGSAAATDGVTSVNRSVLTHQAFSTPGATLRVGGVSSSAAPVTVNVGSPAAGGATSTSTPSGVAGQQTWSASIPLSQLRNLPEGRVRVSMTSGPATAVSKTLVMDRITAPNRPSNVRATAANHAATVTWARSAFNGNSAMTGYRLQVFRGTALVRTINVANISRTTVRRLANGVGYRFAVIAVNAVGKSAASARSNRVVPRR